MKEIVTREQLINLIHTGKYSYYVWASLNKSFSCWLPVDTHNLLLLLIEYSHEEKFSIFINDEEKLVGISL